MATDKNPSRLLHMIDWRRQAPIATNLKVRSDANNFTLNRNEFGVRITNKLIELLTLTVYRTVTIDIHNLFYFASVRQG